MNQSSPAIPRGSRIFVKAPGHKASGCVGTVVYEDFELDEEYFVELDASLIPGDSKSTLVTALRHEMEVLY